MKYLLFIFLVINFSIATSAQTRFGAKLGVNFVIPKMEKEAVTVPVKTNFGIGAFFSKGFTNGNKLVAEINYFSPVDIAFEDGNTLVAEFTGIHFITIPLQYGFKFGKNEFYGLIGVYFEIASSNMTDQAYSDEAVKLALYSSPTGYSGSYSLWSGTMGGKLGFEYVIGKFSIMANYRFYLLGKSMYDVNYDSLRYTHFGASVGYNFIN